MARRALNATEQNEELFIKRREQMARKSITELTVDTKLLTAELAKLDPGEMISYAALSNAISRNVQEEARGNLMSARRIVERDNNAVFEAVHGVGVKRLTDQAIAGSGEKTRKKVHKIAKKTIDRIGKIEDLNSLASEDRAQAFVTNSFAGALYLATKPKTIKLLEAHIQKSAAELSIADTLELFKGKEK